MPRFKADDLFAVVMPYSAYKKGPILTPKPLPQRNCGCTHGCTNTTTTTYAARVSKRDLDTLRRLLGALQRSAPRKKR